ncbi:MAG: 16S rRNA (guanine(527)-N(7))-methyltransferase RsmG [Alphaproteobacteria bacterium]|nr:16S rRNA (guanine(527)-N(7))-methyltransferase RsmG [Alphaproteobacteria bacterium]
MNTDYLKNVSRETIQDLKTFQQMVLEWNSKFNLISKSTETDIWKRHIEDSLQLDKFISEKDKTMYDFGTGAGFPGLVIAIFAKYTFPNLKISLIESTTKKTIFLNEVKNKLNLDINIINERIENLKLKKADIISSRAMASLEKLFEYAINFTKENTKLLFLKGESWQKEIETAQKNWIFSFESIPSITNEKGRVLQIQKLRRKIHG